MQLCSGEEGDFPGVPRTGRVLLHGKSTALPQAAPCMLLARGPCRNTPADLFKRTSNAPQVDPISGFLVRAPGFLNLVVPLSLGFLAGLGAGEEREIPEKNGVHPGGGGGHAASGQYVLRTSISQSLGRASVPSTPRPCSAMGEDNDDACGSTLWKAMASDR